MAELNPVAELEQPGPLDCLCGAFAQSEFGHSLPQQNGITEWLSGGYDKQFLRVAGKCGDPPDETRFDAALGRLRLRNREAPDKAMEPCATREFQQRQRVPSCLGHYTILNPAVYRCMNLRSQQAASVLVVDSFDRQSRERRDRGHRLTVSNSKDDCYSLAVKPARRKRESQRALVIQPVSIIDETGDHHRLSGVNEEAKHGQADKVRVGPVVATAQRGVEGGALNT
jgi:hypothetical protein